MKLSLFITMLHAIFSAAARTRTRTRTRTSTSRMLDPDENDVISNICSDGNKCYNGATCMNLDEGLISPIEGRKTRCDCSPKITTGAEFYAGYGCEYDATEYCFVGEANSEGISFCTNAGKCVEVWRPKDDEVAIHKGCRCKDGWVGEFCEYKDGEQPYFETIENEIPKGEKKSSKALVAAAVTGAVAITVGFAGLFLWKRNQSAIEVPASKSDASSPAPPAPLSPAGSDII